MNTSITALALLAVALSSTGCASITGSKNQPVSMTAVCESEPVNGANCTLANDKGQWFVSTPGSVMIQKSGGDLAVNCKKGESSGGGTFVSKANGGIWGNILAGGLIGYAIDAGSGAGFDYPPNMTVIMGPPCPTT
jgi:hypothetical protein